MKMIPLLSKEGSGMVAVRWRCLPTTPIDTRISPSPRVSGARMWPTAHTGHAEPRRGDRRSCDQQHGSVAPAGAFQAYRLCLPHGWRRGPHSCARPGGLRNLIEPILAPMPTTPAPPPAEEGSRFHGIGQSPNSRVSKTAGILGIAQNDSEERGFVGNIRLLNQVLRELSVRRRER